QELGRLRPGAATARDHDRATHLPLAQEYVAREGSLRTRSDLDRGPARRRADGDDDGVRSRHPNHLRRRLGSEPDIHAQPLHLSRKVLAQLAPPWSVRRRFSREELAAQCIVALEEHDLVPALGGDPRRGHSAGPAADDRDSQRPFRRYGKDLFTARLRVDRAPDVLLIEETRDTPLVARDAAVDLLQPSLPRLVRPVRIGEQRATDRDEVRPAFG